MANSRTTSAIAPLIRALRAQETDGKTDAQLLELFLTSRDETAFSALVRRHGAMVLGVCRRILGNESDAEDAFQATFIVLMRKAGSLRSRPVLSDWLHGVARRTALNVRKTAARRRAKEHAVEASASRVGDARNDWLPLLDDELSRLPEKYRLAIVLCDLEGRTRRETAERLGWPEGTVAGRLTRGRELLAKRLLRGAMVLSGAVPTALAASTAKAAVSAELVHAVVQTATGMAAGGVAAKTVASAKVLTLAQGVMQAMFWSQIKTVVVAVFLIGFTIAVGDVAISKLAGVGGPAAANFDKGEQPRARDGQAEILVPARQPRPDAPAEKHMEVDLGDGVKMKLVRIEPGKFMMGASSKIERDEFNKGEDGKGRDKEEPHAVEITKPFYMGVYAVTQAEYEKLMGKNPSYFSQGGGGKKEIAGLDTTRFPVEFVSWEDAMEFCGNLSQKHGKTFDLPTEAEWEYACRAGSTGPFHFGDSLSSKQANFNGNGPFGGAEKGPWQKRPTTVGSYEANAFGLYDMHGNVLQWCKDWYKTKYYDESPRRDPQGPAFGERRVLRGGHFQTVAWGCRSAQRTSALTRDPFGNRDPNNICIGFRVVLRLPPAEKDEKPPAVRKLELKGFRATEKPKSIVFQPLVQPAKFNSVEELAKAFPDKVWQEKIAKQVDFSKEFLLYFAFTAFEDTSLTSEIKQGKPGPLVVFKLDVGQYKYGYDSIPPMFAQFHLYAIPEHSRWRVEEMEFGGVVSPTSFVHVIREIDLKGNEGKLPLGTVAKPTKITNAEELAKVFTDKTMRDKIAKQSDFDNKYLLFFGWTGSERDKLTFNVEHSKQGTAVIFQYCEGLERAIRQPILHFHLFTIAKDASWRVEDENGNVFAQVALPTVPKIDQAKAFVENEKKMLLMPQPPRPPVLPHPVRQLDLPGFSRHRPDIIIGFSEPTRITSAKDLTKLDIDEVDKAWQNKIAAQVDFTSEQLLSFMWDRGGGLTVKVDKDARGPIIVFQCGPHIPRWEYPVYAIPKAARWRVEMIGADGKPDGSANPSGSVVREVDLRWYKGKLPLSDVAKPTKISNAEELAKFFPDKTLQDEIAKHMLFKNNKYLLFFGWSHVKNDKLTLRAEHDPKGATVIFQYRPSADKAKGLHFHLYAVAKDANYTFERVPDRE